jgi:hypothetical protein
MKFVGKDKLAVYRARAEEFWSAMEHLGEYDVEKFAAAVALLAVHCAISYADALFVDLKAQRCDEQNHSDAIAELLKLCASRKMDDSGVAHFRWLVSRKNDVAYLEKRLDINQVKLARVKAGRFAIWVQKHLRAAQRDSGEI